MRVLLLLLFLLLGGCATTGQVQKPQVLEHVYLEPVTNKTSEEELDVIFSRVADEVFYSDPRFKVDLKPIPDRTLIVKPTILSISTTAVGYDRNDVARQYMMTIKAQVKLIKYGFKKPLYTFTIERYDFYNTYGTASEIEEKRKECMDRIGRQIFREVGERLLVEGSKEVK
ncbi:lipopolysaccharide assembly protein [Thermovibrio guaymasensis]|uniref:Lipopolysaccharide assembly protein n=1 Tax=Thermovibrio guaymasensis TaxID=240167 RepID=A0A420W6N0_9BACT|nr:LPS assembly lipoprotein LptE [Thermovibrio guaymasensis]RKQ61704.1 lipopolysaccharide assembly protein [Thermovibrio guaymasensis]